MTPLAQLIANQLTLKPSKRMPEVQRHANDFRWMIEDTHFFDVTKAQPLMEEIGERTGDFTGAEIVEFYGPYCFLPAPKTWIEFLDPKGQRVGVHIRETADGLMHLVAVVSTGGDLIAFPVGSMDGNTKLAIAPQGTDMILAKGTKADRQRAELVQTGVIVNAQTALFLINQPQLVGRKVHAVHKGAARDLHRTFGRGFPLHGWTEITINVAKPWQIDDGQPHADRLTGSRALHFVRKHIRIRDGKVQYVSAHWRGDAALGIKQSRYLVTA